MAAIELMKAVVTAETVVIANVRPRSHEMDILAIYYSHAFTGGFRIDASPAVAGDIWKNVHQAVSPASNSLVVLDFPMERIRVRTMDDFVGEVSVYLQSMT